MGKQMSDDAIRNEIMGIIQKTLAEKYDTDVMFVSSSDMIIPVLDADSNEKWAKINISIPRGTRNGHGGYTPYDGYAVAEAYKIDKENSEHEKALKKENNAREEKLKEQRRAIRAAKRMAKEMKAE